MPRRLSSNSMAYGNYVRRVTKFNMPKTTVPQVKSIVKRAIARDEEIKFAEVNASYTVSTTIGLYNLANTTQGADGGSHLGDECVLHWLRFSFNMGVADVDNFIRMIIFVWKPNMSYVAPSASSILKVTTALTALTSPLQDDGADQFRILHDQVYTLSTTSGLSNRAAVIRKKFRLKQDYLTGSSNCSNNIYVLLVSDSAAVTDPYVRYSSQIGFSDA